MFRRPPRRPPPAGGRPSRAALAPGKGCCGVCGRAVAAAPHTAAARRLRPAVNILLLAVVAVGLYVGDRALSAGYLAPEPGTPGPGRLANAPGRGTTNDPGRTPPSTVTSGASIRVLRLIYLVPSDRSVQQDYLDSMKGAIEHLQIWFRQQMGNGKTFALHTPVVEAFKTHRPANWYATHRESGGGSFQRNVLTDGFALTGGRYSDPNNIWIYYVDADLPCDQTIGGGPGVAVLASLRELSGRQSLPPCPHTAQNIPAICRWVGGLGHELGHALGLPHPPECEQPTADKGCTKNAIMWLGYISYPDAVLLPAEKDKLNHNPFFSPLKPVRLPFDCSHLRSDGGGCSGTFAGDWDSTYGGITIHLEGSQARGTYTTNNGRITGSLSGNILRGEWEDDTGRGSMQFVLSPEGHSFTGRWTRTQGQGNSEGEWSGRCIGLGGKQRAQ